MLFSVCLSSLLLPHFLTVGNHNATCQILKFAGASAISKSLSLSSHGEICVSEWSTRDDRHTISLCSVSTAAQKHKAFAHRTNHMPTVQSRLCGGLQTRRRAVPFFFTHSSPDQSITSKATLSPQILCYHQASIEGRLAT